MATKIEAGFYEGKIIDYGIGQTKTGNPQVMILFEYNDQDAQRHEITWYGHLGSPKAQKITTKALLYCGMKGNDPTDLADGVASGLLDVETPVKLTVELEPAQDDPTKTYANVAWINPITSGALAKRITKSDAKIKMGALNLKAAMMAARQTTGITERKAAPLATHASSIPMPTDADFFG